MAKFKYGDRVVVMAGVGNMDVVSVGDTATIIENPCTTMPWVRFDRDIAHATEKCPIGVPPSDFAENRVTCLYEKDLDFLKATPCRAEDMHIGAMFNYDGGTFIRIHSEDTTWHLDATVIVALVIKPVGGADAVRSMEICPLDKTHYVTPIIS